MSTTNPDYPAPSIFEEGVQKFRTLKRDSGDVEELFKKSVRLENQLSKILSRFIKASLLAMRAARVLIPSTPNDEVVKDYLHDLVDNTLATVVSELKEQSRR